MITHHQRIMKFIFIKFILNDLNVKVKLLHGWPLTIKSISKLFTCNHVFMCPIKRSMTPNAILHSPILPNPLKFLQKLYYRWSPGDIFSGEMMCIFNQCLMKKNGKVFLIMNRYTPTQCHVKTIPPTKLVTNLILPCSVGIYPL